MATTKVSALASKATLGGSEEILINDGGTSKKSTVTAVRTGITDATKLPLAGGQMTGNITMSGSQTVDGRDVSADGTQLDTNTSAIATKAPIASPTFTGTVAIPNIGNLEAAVSANTAKVTNATHTGDVTGATALTIGNDKVVTAMILDDNVTAAKLANSINTDIATGVTANTTANAALPKAGGTMTGNLVMGTNLVDGIDISARDAVLTSTTTTAGAALPKAGGTLTGTVTVSANAVGTVTTDNDGSFAMSATNNFKCTPTGNFTLTFTSIVAQSGNILLVNSGGHTVSAHANTKVDANLLATVSTAGTYLLSYFSDGTNVYMTNSAIYT